MRNLMTSIYDEYCEANEILQTVYNMAMAAIAFIITTIAVMLIVLF